MRPPNNQSYSHYLNLLRPIWRWGEKADRRRPFGPLWPTCPFVRVYLTRYQRSVAPAFVSRYGIFTLIGALLLVGTAWRLLKDQMPLNLGFQLFALGLLAIMVSGQIFSLPRWQHKYLEMSRAARTCYQ